SGHAHSLGAGWLPGNVLLLSRRLLQGVLGGSSFLHSRRAAQEISRRGFLSFDRAEYPPVFSLSRPGISYHSGPGRVGSILVRWTIWGGPRHSRFVGEPRTADLLHLQLPLASSSGRGFSRSFGRRSRPKAGL